jgi:hypothetical protein
LGRRDPNPTEYAVNVHVSSSSVVLESHAVNSQQQVSVVIDGKR